MSIIKVCGVGILCVCAVMILRAARAELAVLAGVGGAVILFGMALPDVFEIVRFARDISEETGFSVYTATVLKALGIAVLTQMTADICRDCGAGTAAGRIELCAKCAILLLGLPVVKSLIELSKEILL